MGNTSSEPHFDDSFILKRDDLLKMPPDERLFALIEMFLHHGTLSTTGWPLASITAKIFEFFPWPADDVSKDCNEAYNDVRTSIYANNRSSLELYIRRLMCLLSQEIDRLKRAKLSSIPKSINVATVSDKWKKKEFNFNNPTYVNATGTCITLKDDYSIDPIPETLSLVESGNTIGEFNGIQFKHYKLNETHETALEKYNNENSVLIITKEIALRWVDISEDISWLGVIAFPVFDGDNKFSYFYILS